MCVGGTEGVAAVGAAAAAVATGWEVLLLLLPADASAV